MRTTAKEEPIHWTEHGIPFRNLWYMLLYAMNELPLRRISNLEDIEESPPLDAQLAIILSKLIEQRLRIGLGRDYIDDRRLLKGIKGRIDFSECIKKHLFERNQFVCRFQRFSVNEPKNQIIRSTLLRLVQAGEFGPDVESANKIRHKLRALVRAFEGVDLIELKPELIRRIKLGRNDGDYRLILAVCELLLLRLMPRDSEGIHKLPSVDRDAFVYHRIFEKFVANFYRFHLDGWDVIHGKLLRWKTKSPSRYLPIMRPDITLQEKSSGKMIIIDTKFTAKTLIKGRTGKEQFVSQHLYQLYAYLRTQEHISENHRNATGILLYPSTGKRVISESIELQGLTMRIEQVDLTSPWQEIERFLLNLISSIGGAVLDRSS